MDKVGNHSQLLCECKYCRECIQAPPHHSSCIQRCAKHAYLRPVQRTTAKKQCARCCHPPAVHWLHRPLPAALRKPTCRAATEQALPAAFKLNSASIARRAAACRAAAAQHAAQGKARPGAHAAAPPQAVLHCCSTCARPAAAVHAVCTARPHAHLAAPPHAVLHGGGRHCMLH